MTLCHLADARCKCYSCKLPYLRYQRLQQPPTIQLALRGLHTQHLLWYSPHSGMGCICGDEDDDIELEEYTQTICCSCRVVAASSVYRSSDDFDSLFVNPPVGFGKRIWCGVPNLLRIA